MDNYPGNNPLYVNRCSPLPHRETAFAYERIITREGALEEPENAFGSLSDGIIRCILFEEGEREGSARGRKRGREETRETLFYKVREDFTDS